MTKSTTVIVALLVIISFPIWIGLAGGIFGLVFGLIGGIFGLFGAILGAIFGAIGAMFEWIFGGMFHWHHFHGIHFSKLCVLGLVVLVIALAVKSNKKTK